VTSEELLCSANNVSDHDGGAQREDDVLVVRMQNQSLIYRACKEEMSQIQLLEIAQALLPLNPMTADMSSSVDTILSLLSLKSFAFCFLNKIDFNTFFQIRSYQSIGEFLAPSRNANFSV